MDIVNAEHVRIYEGNDKTSFFIVSDPLFLGKIEDGFLDGQTASLKGKTVPLVLFFSVIRPIEMVKHSGSMYEASIGVAEICSKKMRPASQRSEGVVHDIHVEEMESIPVKLYRTSRGKFVIPEGTERTLLLNWVEQTVSIGMNNGRIPKEIVTMRKFTHLPKGVCRKVGNIQGI